MQIIQLLAYRHMAGWTIDVMMRVSDGSASAWTRIGGHWVADPSADAAQVSDVLSFLGRHLDDLALEWRDSPI
jgi:hypothetical protein